MTADRIYYFLLTVVAFTISFPLKTHASGYSIIALSLGWIFLGNWKNKWLQLKKNPLSLLFLAYYPLLLFGLFYSEDIKEAKYLLEKNMAMLVLPLIILSCPKLNYQNTYNTAKSFILGCAATSLFVLCKAVYLYYTKNELHFYFTTLSELAGVHTTYFSLFCCFSVLIIGINTRHNINTLNIQNIIFRILLSAYFLFFMYLLSNRMAFISFFIISFFLVLYYFYKKGKLLSGIIISTVVLISLIYIFSNLWHTRMRFYHMFHPNTEEWKGAETRNEILNRKVHWGCYIDAILTNNLIFGVGTGDWWNSIVPCYKSWDFHGLYQKYNAHNQYLETWLRHGIIGLALWLSMLLIPLWLSLKRKHIYYTVFIVLFALSCLTETMLDRQHGVVFYAFFNAVFGSYYLGMLNRKI